MVSWPVIPVKFFKLNLKPVLLNIVSKNNSRVPVVVWRKKNNGTSSIDNVDPTMMALYQLVNAAFSLYVLIVMVKL